MPRRPKPSSVEITPEIVLRAYAAGIFPMAESADDPGLFWIEPEQRGVFPLDALNVSRSLAKLVRSDRFSVRINTAFDAVLDGCAESRPGRSSTWINARIRALYAALFARSHVHSIECWRGDRLVGGLYGVSLGAAFFGESMFHRETDASKVALVHLVARLRFGGFELLDTQFVTPHLASLGAVEIPRSAYRVRLSDAVTKDADFLRWPVTAPMSGAQALALVAGKPLSQTV